MYFGRRSSRLETPAPSYSIAHFVTSILFFADLFNPNYFRTKNSTYLYPIAEKDANIIQLNLFYSLCITLWVIEFDFYLEIVAVSTPFTLICTLSSIDASRVMVVFSKKQNLMQHLTQFLTWSFIGLPAIVWLFYTNFTFAYLFAYSRT